MLISGELINVICWSSLLFGIFVIKKGVVFSLTSFGTLSLKSIGTLEPFGSAIIASHTTNILFSLWCFYSAISFQMSCTLSEYSMKALGSLTRFN